MKIVEWISYDEAMERGLTEAVGGSGGDPVARRLDEYLEATWPASKHPYILAIAEAMDGLGPIGGFAHQASMVPVFEDDTCGTFSLRAWGDLVAAWWNTKHDDHLSYCAFSWADGFDGVWFDEDAIEVRRAEHERRSTMTWGDHVGELLATLEAEAPEDRVLSATLFLGLAHQMIAGATSTEFAALEALVENTGQWVRLAYYAEELRRAATALSEGVRRLTGTRCNATGERP